MRRRRTIVTKGPKKKSDREKGLEFQRWIKAWLVQRNWDTVNIPPRGILIKDKKTGETRFVSLSNDIFGCDLIARKAWGTSHFKEIWIQAMVGYGPGKKLQQVSAHPIPQLFKETYLQIETHIWLKPETGLINIKRVISDGSETSLEDLGKIIRGKFYGAEGIAYEF